MTIGQKLHKVMDHLTPGHNKGSGDDKSDHSGHAYATSSAGQYGTMEQAGAGAYSTGYQQGTGAYAAGGASPVETGSTHFAVTEDHVVEKERAERWVEHQPVEREYVTRVEEVGARPQAGWAEGGVAQERVVGAATAFPTNTQTITGVAGRNLDTNRAGGLDGNPNTRI